MLTQTDISDVELKQRWRLYWLNYIFEFSNIELQRESWVNGSTKWPSSFEESMIAYFDNLALYKGYEEAIKAGNVSKEEADMAATFHQLAAFYDAPSENPQDILEDDEWLEVVEAAKELWTYLKGTLRAPRELTLVEKLEKEFS